MHNIPERPLSSQSVTMFSGGLIKRPLAHAILYQRDNSPSQIRGLPEPNGSHSITLTSPNPDGKRQIHVVSTLAQRRNVLCWMVEDFERNGPKK